MNRILNVILSLSLISAISGCSVTMQTVKRGNVDASMDKTIQDAKDTLNTYGFDLQSIIGSSHDSNLIAEHIGGQKAWVEIDRLAASSTAVKVKVNKKGRDKVSADAIFDDIQARSQK